MLPTRYVLVEFQRLAIWLCFPSRHPVGYAQVCGAFGAYVGFPLADCKRAVKEAFDEFGEITDWNQSHFVGISLLAGRTVESLQLKAFSENPTSELHAYPEAFVESQERNFGTSDERFGETIHKLIQVAGTRGLRRALPAYVGARMRRPQLLKFLDDRDSSEAFGPLLDASSSDQAQCCAEVGPHI